MRDTTSSRQCWRELEALVELPETSNGEFVQPPLTADDYSRREFLQTAGASLAVATFAGCTSERHEGLISPVQSSHTTPGKPLFFATAMTLGGYAEGLLIEHHMGRPIKVEGNPDHPASLGATSAYAQAAMLDLYDADRSQHVLHDGQSSSWNDFLKAFEEQRATLRSSRGRELRILTQAITSPTLARELQRLKDELPEMRWNQYEPVGRENSDAGAMLAFGTTVEPLFHLDRADVIVTLDCDLLNQFPGHLRYVADFAKRRRVWDQPPAEATMNRLYSVGPTPTLTSAVADHRLPVRAYDVATLAILLARRLGISLAERTESENVTERLTAWVDWLASDLESHRGRSLVITGEGQPAIVHALSHAINDRLGNVGQTVSYIQPVRASAPSGMAALRELTNEMRAGEVQVLLVLGANPAYSAPADLNFTEALQNVPFSVSLASHEDETAQRCRWHLPQSHFMETWGDARAFDGTASIQQPVFVPLSRRISALQLIALLQNRSESSEYSIVREHWEEQWKNSGNDFEQQWRRAVHEGVVRDSASSITGVELREQWANEAVSSLDSSTLTAEGDAFEVVFRPDPTLYDGRFANNAWLQELPKPLTSVTWDNVAVFGPETAAKLGLQVARGSEGGDLVADVVRLRYQDRELEAPAWIMPGHAELSVTLFLGSGRSAGGQIGRGRGYNAYQLRTSERPWFDSGLQVERTGRRYRLAATQLHHRMAGRDLARHGTLDEYRRDPAIVAVHHSPENQRQSVQLPVIDSPEKPGLHPERRYDERRWGMVIDLNTCVGCSACVIACQAENNIPSVGKQEVMRGREMHWLRVDAYHAGAAEEPEATFFQPVPCMHCEKAPCEIVCPVNATVHSDEGLNDMNYARCVGTRYCSNNCPYKVRRFNYFEYASWDNSRQHAPNNPDVTVRSRGVMEKCTYCVQRINEARIHAEKDQRPLVKNREGQWLKPIYPGELLTACQAACPTRAIVFGDLNDTRSEVAKMRFDQPLNYGLLDEQLDTQPRTTYLAALRNPRSINSQEGGA